MRPNVLVLNEDQKTVLCEVLKNRVMEIMKETSCCHRPSLNEILDILNQLITKDDLKIIKRLFVLEAHKLIKEPTKLQELAGVYYKITAGDLKTDYTIWFDFNKNLLVN